MSESAPDPVATSSIPEQRVASYSDLLHLPSVASVLLICSATLAISHEISYFYAVGAEAIYYFTASDLIKSIIGWLPATVILALPGILLGQGFRNADPFVKTYLEEGIFSRRAILLHKMTVARFWIAGLCTLYLLIFLLAMNVWTTAVAFFGFIGIFLVATRIFVAQRERGRAKFADSEYFPSIFTIGILFSIGLAIGYSDGQADLRTNSPVIEIKSDGVNITHGIMMKAGEKGILLRRSEKIYFIPWDNIKFTSYRAEASSRRSVFGAVYDWWYRDPPLLP